MNPLRLGPSGPLFGEGLAVPFILYTWVQTGSGIFVCDPLTTNLYARGVGGGGAGAGADAITAQASMGGGGGGGGCFEKMISISGGDPVAYSVGLGGAPVSGAAGLAGAATTLTHDPSGASCSAGGGGGGAFGGSGTNAIWASPGAAGVATGGDINHTGSAGDLGWRVSGIDALGGSGGSAPFGSGGLRGPIRFGGANESTAGSDGSSGSGGTGGICFGTGAAVAGGRGGAGYILFIEW